MGRGKEPDKHYASNAANTVTMPAAPGFETDLYTSEAYAEGAGTVLFRLATREVCVLRPRGPKSQGRDEHVVLPGWGRRRVGEAPADTALREITEETGFSCRLLPVNLSSRALPPSGSGSGEDALGREPEPEIGGTHLHKGVCEPVGLQLRRGAAAARAAAAQLELVWWFVAAVNEGEPRGRRRHEGKAANGKDKPKEGLEVDFLSYEDALQALASPDDRALVEKTMAVVNATQISQKSRASTICFGRPG